MIITSSSSDRELWKTLAANNPMHDARLDLKDAVADILARKGRTQICCGIPGMGKTTIVRRELRRHDVPFKMIDHVAPLQLCETLEECASNKSVIVFDDADGIFVDDTKLTILQKAIYSSDEEPRLFDWKGRTFCFDGTQAIILTNRNVKDYRSFGPKTGLRVRSFVSRCRSIVLRVSREDAYNWAIYLATCEALLGGFGCSIEQANDALRFFAENANCMPDLSVRVLIEIAELRRERPESWRRSATHSYVDGPQPRPLSVPPIIPQIGSQGRRGSGKR